MADEPPDEPLRDSLGRKRSPATFREYHAGSTPPNKGRSMELEILTPKEISDLFAVKSGSAAGTARDRAITSLMYRADLKIHQIELLERRDYDPETGNLKVPGTQGGQARTVQLDSRSRELLDEWIEARRQLGVRRVARLFCQVPKPATGNDLDQHGWREGLRARADKAGIEKRVNPEGLRASGQAHGVSQLQRLEGQIEAYVDDHHFRIRYPDAYDKWEAAYELYMLNPEREATRIGHDCREALMAFASQLATHHGVTVNAPVEKTVIRLRAVIAEQRLSKRVREFLTALVNYWRSVSDLAQRQEHGASREGEPLRAEDARRLIFQTMLVMYEVDRALDAP